MAFSKVILNGTTLIDLTQDTVVAGNLLSPNTAHNAAGVQITGTASTGTPRTSSDLTASGATVTAPAGYYAEAASKAVASGTEGTPTATKGTVSNHSVNITPSVTNIAGYISGGTKTGTAVTVSASELVSDTLTVDSSGTKDVTNYASASIPAGTAGTPSASKGTVSNHSISVTPSVTNTTGWITGDTKTGTAVTVTASELASGNKAISANGTGIDVVGYSTVSVAVPGPNLQSKTGIVPTESSQTIQADSGYDGLSSVQINAMPSGTAGTPTATKGTVSNHSVSVTPSVTNTTGYITGNTKTGTAVTVSASELVSGNKEITSNGNNIDVADYSTVSVSVASSGGSSKNFQVASGGNRVATTTYTAVSGQELTVAETGTYNVYWSGYRSSTSGTSGSQLYIGDSAYGSVNTTFSNNLQTVKLTGVSLTKNQIVTVRARARGTSYYMYVSNLTIEQTA